MFVGSSNEVSVVRLQTGWLVLKSINSWAVPAAFTPKRWPQTRAAQAAAALPHQRQRAGPRPRLPPRNAASQLTFPAHTGELQGRVGFMLLPTTTDTTSGNVLSWSTSLWAQAPRALVALNDGAEGRSLGRGDCH